MPAFAGMTVVGVWGDGMQVVARREALIRPLTTFSHSLKRERAKGIVPEIIAFSRP
jgi:hypothetical protein